MASMEHARGTGKRLPGCAGAAHVERSPGDPTAVTLAVFFASPSDLDTGNSLSMSSRNG
jgi:hypothetical protein